MADTEITEPDLNVEVGTILLPNGEWWVRFTFEVGLLGTKLDLPPDHALKMVLALPNMVLEAVDVIHGQNGENNGNRAEDTRED